MSKSKKHWWEIQTPVESASGCQLWRVQATSAEDALKVFEAGGGEFVEEEVEVTDLGDPEVVGGPYPITEEASASKKEIVVVGEPRGGWEGLFVDGKLVEEGHSLHWSHVLDALKVEYRTVEADGEWMDNQCRLPENLSEVKLNKGEQA